LQLNEFSSLKTSEVVKARRATAKPVVAWSARTLLRNAFLPEFDSEGEAVIEADAPGSPKTLAMY
jgi:hypothetical protein